MRRRELLMALGGTPWMLGGVAAAAAPEAFSADTVALLAKAASRQPFQAPTRRLPAALSQISYDAYRAIRYRPERALWRDRALPFQVELFFRGLYFPERIDLYEVDGGRRTSPIAYDSGCFESDKLSLTTLPSDLGYAGFRLHAPLNRPDYYDEAASFLGASYFRSLGRGQTYGLSARGLALNTAAPGGEEFPVFKSFWIERPAANAPSIVVHALLDSRSTTGAYRFSIRPGDWTVFDVQARLFPRVGLDSAGLAPLTSMFLFGEASARRFDDFRRAAHDSDGLQIANGAGERLWRPLSNPLTVQESAFKDHNPRGFGLIQRSRTLSDFEDLEARYDLRPSLWVEPQGDWGPGAVHLIEFPEATEHEDNIVAFWRPQAPLAPGVEHAFNYRLSWGPPPPASAGLAQVAQTRAGAGVAGGARQFAIDFAGDRLDGAQPRVWSSAGDLSTPTLTPNPRTGGVRLDFQLTPGAARVIELRAELLRSGTVASESWMYRWTA